MSPAGYIDFSMADAPRRPSKRWDIVIIVSGVLTAIYVGFPWLGAPLWVVVLSAFVVIVAADAITAHGLGQGIRQTPRALADAFGYLAVSVGSLIGLLLIFSAPVMGLYFLVGLIKRAWFQ